MADNISANNQVKQSEDFISIQDFLYMCLSKWYWFAISLVVLIALALIYIMRTPPEYTRSASMLIKEEGKGQSISSDVSSAFASMGLVQSNTNVNNEVIALQSPAIMTDVVKRLHLDVNYKVSGRFYDRVLYGQNLPVSVSFLDLNDNESASFTIKPAADGTLGFSDFVRNGEESDAEATGKLNDTIETPVGRIVVSTTPYYSGTFDSDVYVSRSTIYGAVQSYSQRLSVGLANEDATIINLSITDVCIQRAEDVLNTLIAVYNENWLKDKNQIAVSTSMFINDRLKVIENELGTVDADIASYKGENLLPDIQAASSMYMSQSQETNAQILELSMQLSMAKYIKSYLAAGESQNQLLPANSGISGGNIENQISEYNTAQLQRNNLVANSSDENPLVKDMDNALKSMREAIITSIDNLVVTLNTQIETLERTNEQIMAKIAASPSQAKDLLSDERQQKVKEALYLFLLEKREENELSQAFTAYNTRIITPPTGSMLPTAPVKRNIFLIAIALGVLIPIAVIFIKEMLNTAIRGRKDIEGMNVPFLGEIPLIGKKKRFSRLAGIRQRKKKYEKEVPEIVVRAQSRDVINEAFRVVRTNLEFVIGKEEGPKVIMVTSMNPDSGKTFVISNLAASFAIKKKKTVIVDLDLRKATLSSYVGNIKTGVSNYLADKDVSVFSITFKDKSILDLDIIPVGTIPPNPAELLFSERLGQLLSELKQKYDYIFIDCPPAEVVADTSIIGRHADYTLFIARSGLLDKRMLPQIDRFYVENRFKGMMLVLNGTEVAQGRYGYRKYGYSYGYNYGYGSYEGYVKK